MQDLLGESSLPPSLLSVALHLVASLLLVRPALTHCDHLVSELVQTVFHQSVHPTHVLEFCWELVTVRYPGFYVVSVCYLG